LDVEQRTRSRSATSSKKELGRARWRATTGRHIDPWDSGSEEWGVDPEEKWIEITGAERELLKQAGAEDELPNLWCPCE
jgi:hypothetical protein